MTLDIQESVDAHAARIVLKGELDASSAPALRAVVEEVLKGGPAQLFLYVEELSFMASAGLRIIIFAKQRQPDLKIYFLKPQETVLDTLHKTGFLSGVYIADHEPAGP
jgi:anti-anti-sigma factor